MKAFTCMRMSAEGFMDERARAGLGWTEESVTDVAMYKGLPAVHLVPL